ncbi:hypothetical protein HS088_TW01G00379 [Tripterygium wilfordii]|uniref:Uncharacterized protein n=1 Tax=Tripterygium wilfordii TaxID=458696 RepID=A0A7J7E1Q1_TRIWF|nr:hypothetical protein HS088_TW01G00379 [Tripterygium wilfordii]
MIIACGGRGMPPNNSYNIERNHCSRRGRGRPPKKCNLKAIPPALGFVREKLIRKPRIRIRTNPHVIADIDASIESQVRDHMINWHKRKRSEVRECEDWNLRQSSSSPSSYSLTKTNSPLTCLFEIPGPIPDVVDIIQDERLFVDFWRDISEDD